VRWRKSQPDPGLLSADSTEKTSFYADEKSYHQLCKGAWYPRGQDRLLRSLIDVKWTGDVHYFTDESQLGCPTHQERPYAFKPHAFDYAINKGCEIALWADAACWAVKSLDPLFDHIEKEGHVFFHSGWNCGQWSTDASLAHFGISSRPSLGNAHADGLLLRPRSAHGQVKRVPAPLEGIYPVVSGAMDQHHPRGVHATRGASGTATIKRPPASSPHSLKCRVIVGHHTFFQYYENEVHTAFVYGAENDLQKMNPDVCIYTQGM
jgi:hypothetical protein